MFLHMQIWERHVKEDLEEHDIHCGPKSYKLKCLRKLVVQQFQIIPMYFSLSEIQHLTFLKLII